MRIRFIELILNKKHILTLLAMLCVCVPIPALAATLTLSPSSSSVSVGNITTVSIKVDTGGLAVNNAEGVIQFPNDVLEVISISKSSSIFTLWVEEPSFSNGTGRIVFNGGAANPGFNGSNGTIASIVFKAKKQGTASVLFTDGAVRKNDGLGTNILSSKNGSTITIGIAKPAEIPEVVVPDKSQTSISKPVISSDTHPDQNRWYKNTSATLSWKIPSGVTSIQTLFNKTSNSTPTVSYDNSVTQKTISSISDGISYFHLRYKNENNLSAVTHYVIKVDATPPKSFEPKISIVQNRALVTLDAEDSTSGIDFYTLKIDNQQLQKVSIDQIVDGTYLLPYQNEGNHSLIVTAYDKAENQTVATVVFTTPKISIPQIELSSEDIQKGDTVTILGKSEYPNTQVEVLLFMGDEEVGRYTQTTSEDGSFSVVTEKIKKVGVIEVSARSVLGENVSSQLSEKIHLTVSETQFEKISFALFSIIVVVVLFVVLLIALYIGWHKFFGLKRRMNQELMVTVKNIHEATMLFKEDLELQLDTLEKIRVDRALSQREEVVFAKVKKNLDTLDKFIENKLKKLM